MENKGTLFALLTAVISGSAVFVNSFGVSFGDPFVYTTLKNSAVGLFILSSVILLGEWGKLLSLGRKHAGKLLAVGVIGGGIPFLLFFYGLSISSAASASFFYRLLFVLAAVMGVAFFKEKVSKEMAAGAALAIIGSYAIAGNIAFGFGELLVLAAAALWAVEYAVSKKLLQELPVRMVACSRMVVGSAVLLLFVAATGRAELLSAISAPQMGWALLSSGFLILFVFAWYSALKHSSLSSATAALALGAPVTAALSVAFLGKVLLLPEGIGLLVMSAGLFLVVGVRSATNAFLHLPGQIRNVLT